MNRRLTRAMVIVVVMHLVANTGHAVAHVSLGVTAPVPNTVFIILVIFTAPVVAAILWTRHQRLGAWLLLGSMSAAALFGAYFHYVKTSPDHVDHLPAGDLQQLFRLTAALLLSLECIGAVLGIVGIAWDNKNDS
jgi:hypothetical protein